MYQQQNQFQQQQPQVPFNPTAPQGPFLNIGLGNPPYVPAAYNTDQYLQSYLPLVSAMLAMEIQQNAQKNPLRMFMFNQYSQNNFANQDFDALVLATMDYMLLGLKQGRWQNGEQAAQQAVPEMTEMLCAINMRLFPGLEAFITQEAVNPIRTMIAQFDQTCQAINMMKNQMSGQGQQQWGGQQQGGFSQWGGGQQQRGGFSQQQGQGQHSWNRATPQGNVQTSGSMLFSTGPVSNAAPATAQGSSVSPGKYGATGAQGLVQQPFTPRQETPAMQTTNATPPAPAATPPTEVLASSGQIKWRPSVKFPYIPAFIPSTQQLFFKQHPDGSVEPIVRERTATDMDYDRHATTTTFGPAPKALDLSGAAKTMGRIEDGISQVNNATGQLADNKPADVPEILTYVKDEKFLDTCVSSAWFTGAMERMRAPDGKMPAVYRIYAGIGDPMISQHDETEAIRNFGNSNTFIELREKLNAAIKDVSPELWGASNIRLTEAINRVLAQNMSLPKLSIESFVSDIQDLIDHIGNKFGDAIQEAFLKNQKDLIKALFCDFNKHSEEMSASMLEGRTFADGVTPKITFLASNYSLTYLDCVSHELDIELATGVATAVVQGLTPVMYEMLDGLFKDVDARVSADPEKQPFLRHLIRTNDGRQLEATRGYLGNDFYMLTLIK